MSEEQTHRAPHAEDEPTHVDLLATGARIDSLIEALAAGGVGPTTPARTRERAEELVRVVTDLYGAGLERVLEIAHDSGRLDDGLLAQLADDDLVSSLLLVHGLHPYDVTTRVEHALDSVRPYLGSHGGDVELLEVTDDGVVRLRMLGSCDGCPSSSVTLELAVQDAIEAEAPEVVSIEVVSIEVDSSTSGLIPVEALRARLSGPDPATGHGATWHPVPGLHELASGAARTVPVGDTVLFGCRVGHQLFVFRDSCGRCAGSLGGALPVRRLGGAVGDAVLTCPRCGAHFDVRRAGACLDDPDLHLDPLPLLVEHDQASVALPAAMSGPVPGPIPEPVSR